MSVIDTRVATCASVGSTVERIDRVLAESAAIPVVTSCAHQADELAVVVTHLADEEVAAGGRARTLTALYLLGRALAELAAQLREVRP